MKIKWLMQNGWVRVWRWGMAKFLSFKPNIYPFPTAQQSSKTPSASSSTQSSPASKTVS